MAATATIADQCTNDQGADVWLLLCELAIFSISQRYLNFIKAPVSPVDPDKASSVASSSNIPKEPASPYGVSFSEREYERHFDPRQPYPWTKGWSTKNISLWYPWMTT